MAIGKNIGTYSEAYGQLRFLVKDDDLLVCVTDVARSLGYKRPNDAIRDHCRYAERYTADSIYGGREFARFADWFEALDFVSQCCLPGADEYEMFLRKQIDKYRKEYTSFSGYDYLDDWDDDEIEEEEYDEEDDDCGDEDEYAEDESDEDAEGDLIDPETERLALTNFVIMMTASMLDALNHNMGFNFGASDADIDDSPHKREVSVALLDMLDMLYDLLLGRLNIAA